MNKDIKINDKQMKLLAVEVLISNVKSDYDRRNPFDDHVVRLVAGMIIKDGYSVILHPSKSIEKLELALQSYDGFEDAMSHYKYLYSMGIAKRDIDIVSIFGDKKGSSFSDKRLTEAFESSYPYKNMLRMKSQNRA